MCDRKAFLKGVLPESNEYPLNLFTRYVMYTFNVSFLPITVRIMPCECKYALKKYAIADAIP